MFNERSKIKMVIVGGGGWKNDLIFKEYKLFEKTGHGTTFTMAKEEHKKLTISTKSFFKTPRSKVPNMSHCPPSEKLP